jgi:hypothetical protein
VIAHCDGQLVLREANLGAGYTDYDVMMASMEASLADQGLAPTQLVSSASGKVGPGQALGQEFAGGPSEHEDYCH